MHSYRVLAAYPGPAQLSVTCMEMTKSRVGPVYEAKMVWLCDCLCVGFSIQQLSL